MMQTPKQLVIWGTGGLGMMLRKYIQLTTPHTILSYCASAAYITADRFDDLPLCADEHLLDLYPPDSVEVALTVGFKGMNRFRGEMFQSLKARGYTLYSYTHPSAVISSTDIGEGNIILENTIVGFDCNIGFSNIIMRGVVISHDITIGNFNYISDGTVLGGFVNIKNNCFTGLNATIFPDTVLENRTLVGAAAVLGNHTAEDSVYIQEKTRRIESKKSTDIFKDVFL